MKVFGVRIFDYPWENAGETVLVTDPLYHQQHRFNVYRISVGRKVHTFAAGEFSNNVYGFYV